MHYSSIETEYGGVRYRSRTEARWAVLFDLAGIDFQYEPEGFKLESGFYVPDFWLRPWNCYFEVKPDAVVIAAGHYCDERSRGEDLAMLTGHDVIFGCGNPHVLLKVARIKQDGIPPLQENLHELVSPHWIARAMNYRFDWNRPNRAVPKSMNTWTTLGDAANAALRNKN